MEIDFKKIDLNDYVELEIIEKLIELQTKSLELRNYKKGWLSRKGALRGTILSQCMRIPTSTKNLVITIDPYGQIPSCIIDEETNKIYYEKNKGFYIW